MTAGVRVHLLAARGVGPDRADRNAPMGTVEVEIVEDGLALDMSLRCAGQAVRSDGRLVITNMTSTAAATGTERRQPWQWW